MKTNKNNTIKVWACALGIMGMIGCGPVVVPVVPEPTPQPTPVVDLQKEAVIKATGPNSQILSNYYVVRKEEGSMHLCIVDPNDNTVRVLLLAIP